ncbi:uncharacterized protein [Watersipora subatra]|uniref:uncharacterized protein n=1 Tax=Watersipora subatra TaxID=2589382 RepID=UPI00355AD1E6
MAQTSTAVSDLVLALSSFYAAYRINGHPFQSFYGLLVIGLAASLGAFRFALTNPSLDLIDAHKVFSWLGSIVGVPLLTAGLFKHHGYTDITLIFTYVPLGFLFLYKILPQAARDCGNAALSVVSVLSMVLICSIAWNVYGIASSLVIIFAAGTGTDGLRFGVPNVDLFHYLLATSNICYMYAVKF